MSCVPVPANESERLQALRRYGILDTPPEAAFDRITALAARLFGVPMAAISLVDQDRQWFKSAVGLTIRQTPRDVSFCAHTILSPEPLIVPDACLDARFCENPFVSGEPNVRFYAGAPLRTPDGHCLGALCVVDHSPRSFSPEEQANLAGLADLAADLLEKRRLDRDFTEREQAEEAERRKAETILRESEERFRTFMDNSPAVAFIKDEAGHMIYVNKPFERIFGVTLAELEGKTQRDWLPADVVERLHHADMAVLNTGESLEIIQTVPTPDGVPHYWLTFKFPMTSAQGERYVGGVAIDVTERKQAEDQVEHLAYHDMLTGLPNRLLFKDRLDVCLAQARRSRQQLAVLFLDLDRFKVVNDSLGHQIGDLLLKQVAERLVECVREEDTVSRLGGDEFVILLAQITRAEDAGKVAQKIIESLKPPFRIEGRELFVSTSIGVSLYPIDGADSDALLQNADTAMYRAKQQGRNSYQLFTPAMNRRAVETLSLETGLHKALKNNELIVHYQPQVDLQTGVIIGMEALVRWQHLERGMVSPADFIPLAEETGLIMPIGQWVLRTACRQVNAWQAQGHHPLQVAVNVSLRQFQQHDFVPQIAQILKETGLSPASLDLEITESIAMESVDHKIVTLQGLKALGVKLSLDDFGTGFSSLSYLKRLPIDVVKIDRSFVQTITTDTRDAAIATSIIRMAHSLRLKVIAEGVENVAQWAFLKKHRCDTMQGYLFSKPVSAEEMTGLLNAKMQYKGMGGL